MYVSKQRARYTDPSTVVFTQCLSLNKILHDLESCVANFYLRLPIKFFMKFSANIEVSLV